MFLEERRDAHSVPGKAQRGGGDAEKATVQAAPGKERGPRGDGTGLGGRFEWSRGAEGGGGCWLPEPGRGTAAPEGQEARPAPRARGKLLCSEVAAATKPAGRRGGGRCRVEAARHSRAFSPDSPDKACRPLGKVPAAIAVSVAAATKARRRGFSGYVVTGPTPMLPFWRGCGRGSVGKTPHVCGVAWTRALAASLG